MSLDWNWILLLAGALLVLVEVALGGFAGFDLVLIGSAFVLGGAIGMMLGNPVIGLFVASGLCVFYIVVGRRWVRSRIRTTSTRSNVDAVLGQLGRVTARVAEHEAGQVKLRDEVWRALPSPDAAGPLEPGAIVVVTGIDGVTLQVRESR